MASETRGNVLIYSAASGLAVAGFANPLPLADALYIIPSWAGMLAGVAHAFEVKFDTDAFKTMMGQILLGMGVYVIGVGVFSTIVKWTGVGTFPAAIVNAALNFSFTVVLGKVYQAAWAEGREPAANEIEKQFKNAVDKVRAMDSAARARLKLHYEQLRAQGLSQKDALTKALVEYFGFE